MKQVLERVGRLVSGWRATALLAATLFVLSACSGGAGVQPEVKLTLPNPLTNDVLALGQKVHIDTCAVCHGQVGEGGIGPALTGVATRLSDVEHLGVVLYGRGQMQSFRALIDPDEIVAVVAYQRERLS